MRILVIEPSGISRKMLAALLDGFGHDVITASTGQEAFEILHSDEDLKVVLTSLEVPEHSGLEICWEARTLSQKRPLYIIAMSSSHDDSKLSEVLDSGADDFIGKPPVPQQLQARLRAAERLLSVQYELLRLATRDPLSNLHNRRAFFETAEEWIDENDGDAAIALVMIDIDHFKKVNDTYGHAAGDATVKMIGEILRASQGFPARIGGEEFAVLLRGTTRSELDRFVETLRLRIAETPVYAGEATFSVTASLGVAEYQPGTAIDYFVKSADVALYAAKRRGRNRAVFASVDTSDVHRLQAATAP